MKLQHRSLAQPRRRFCASFAVVAVGLGTFGAVAYACSGGNGSATTLSATSGTHGTSLAETTGASSGLAPNKKGFFFRYAAPGSGTACHHVATGIGASVTSTASGTITAVPRTIPNLGSVAGTGAACWSVTGTMNNAWIAADKFITVN